MIEKLIEDKLKINNISVADFSELVIRLLDYGVVVRTESQIESALYDRYVQCAEVVEDYLSILKIKIQHDKKFCFVRVFPPGALVPGLPDDEHGAFNGGFRAKPNQQEVAVILTLRVEYEKALREGLVDDKGCVTIPLEGLVIAMKNLLNKTLPDGAIDRKSIFKRLRQLRLIQFNSEVDFESTESWLRILPSITSFINDEALSHLYPAEQGAETSDQKVRDQVLEDPEFADKELAEVANVL